MTPDPRLERLRHAFASGRTRPLAWRRQQLQRLRRLLIEGADELIAAVRLDLGRPEVEARIAEIALPLAELDLALRHLRRWTRPEHVPTPLVQQPGSARVVREPLGVVLIIAPWNYPVQLLITPLVAALAAGNCAVLKPSEISAHTTAALARLIPQYLDADCITVIEGGPEQTAALLGERFDHVFFTGNGTVGRQVMTAAARHLTPVTLELGGKSPCLVDAEVDVAVAARRIAWGRFLNAGQTCIAPDYVLVHAARHDALLAALTAAIRAFYGADPSASADYGRIINERHHQRLVALLRDGEIVCGGQHDASRLYLAPTVLRAISTDAPVMQEEIFGPILPVLPVADLDAGIAFVNARESPLALYVFTSSSARARDVVERTRSGGVCINGCLWQAANPHLPFGGVGASGIGAGHGRSGFETFSQRRAIVERSTRIDPRLAYPPYTRLKAALLRRLF